MDIEKLPLGVRNILRERGRSDAEVAIMSPREVFEDYCNWNGIINWSDTLWEMMHTLQAASPAAAVTTLTESAHCVGYSKPLAGAETMNPDGRTAKVVVVMTGGIVDRVVADEVGLSVAVIDYDKNADLDDMIVIPRDDGECATALADIHDVVVDAAQAQVLYAAVEEAAPAAEAVAHARP